MATVDPQQEVTSPDISNDYTELESVPLDLGGKGTRADTPAEISRAAEAVLLATNFDPDVLAVTNRIHDRLDTNSPNHDPDMAYRELQDLTMRVNVSRLISEGQDIDFARVKSDLAGVHLANVSLEEARAIFAGSDPDHILHQQHISPATKRLIANQEHLYGPKTREFVAGQVAGLEEAGLLARIDSPRPEIGETVVAAPAVATVEEDTVQQVAYTEPIQTEPETGPDLTAEVSTLREATGYRTSQLSETEAKAVDSVLDALGIENDPDTRTPFENRRQRVRAFQEKYMPETHADGDAGPATRTALIREATDLEEIAPTETLVALPTPERTTELQAAVATLVTTPGNVFRTTDLNPEQASAARALLANYGGPEAREILSQPSENATGQLIEAARAFEKDLGVTDTGDIGPKLRAALIERAAAAVSEPAALPRPAVEVRPEAATRPTPHGPVIERPELVEPDLSETDQAPAPSETEIDIDTTLSALPDIMPITTGGEVAYFAKNGEPVDISNGADLPRGVNYFINGVGYEMGHDTSPNGFYGDGGHKFTTGSSHNSTEGFIRDFATEYGDRFPEMKAQIDAGQIGSETVIALMTVHTELRERGQLAQVDSDMRTKAY